MVAEPASHRIEVNDLSLHYVEYAPPSPEALPVVMLHGLTSAGRTWQRVAERLAEEYHVRALDQRGHGDSDWAAADRYGTEDYLADLEGFLDGLGIGRAILVGQSMGGHNTIAFTARRPERVICALANDIPPALTWPPADANYEAQYPGGRQPIVATVEEWIAPRRALPTMEFTPEWAFELMAEAQLEPVEGGYQAKHDPNAAMHWRPADLWEEAKAITTPTLFIRGGRSNVLDAQTLQDMDMAIPGARSITLEKAGHNTYHDMFEEWVTVARDFLAAHRER